MALYEQDFTMEANTLKEWTTIVTIDGGALVPTGDVVEAIWGMTPFQQSTSPLVTKKYSLGQILIPEDGVFKITLLPSDTVGLSGNFTHELKLIDAGGYPQTVTRGTITINYQVANNS